MIGTSKKQASSGTIRVKVVDTADPSVGIPESVVCELIFNDVLQGCVFATAEEYKDFERRAVAAAELAIRTTWFGAPDDFRSDLYRFDVYLRPYDVALWIASQEDIEAHERQEREWNELCQSQGSADEAVFS